MFCYMTCTHHLTVCGKLSGQMHVQTYRHAKRGLTMLTIFQPMKSFFWKHNITFRMLENHSSHV